VYVATVDHSASPIATYTSLSPNITQVVERRDWSAKDAKNAKGAKKQRIGVLLASLSFASFASFADKKPARMVAAVSMRE
jgi:hypothetical protein